MIIAQIAQNEFSWGPIVVSVCVGVFVGSVVGIITEPLRRWFLRPVLSLSFAKDEHCLRETFVTFMTDPVSQGLGKYVRFRVSNEKRFMAKDCTAYLMSVEKVGPDGSAVLLLADRVPLTWAYIGEAPTDIPGNTGLYCDLFNANERGNQVMPTTKPVPNIFPSGLLEHATYRFEAMVAGENISPVRIRISVAWKGDWKMSEVWQEVT